jgi:hypothetical protein
MPNAGLPRVSGGSLNEDYDDQDGRQNQTQAHGESLGNLVRLEFRTLCRGRHVAGVHPPRWRREHL